MVPVEASGVLISRNSGGRDRIYILERDFMVGHLVGAVKLNDRIQEKGLSLLPERIRYRVVGERRLCKEVPIPFHGRYDYLGYRMRLCSHKEVSSRRCDVRRDRQHYRRRTMQFS